MTLVHLVLAWCCGLLLGHLLWSQGSLGCAAPRWPLGVGAAGLLLLLLLTRRYGLCRLGWLLAIACLLGVWRYSAHPLDPCLGPAHVAYYHSPEGQAAWVTVEGVVSADPEQDGARAVYRLQAESMRLAEGWQPVRGALLVYALPSPQVRYGDRLRLSGILRPPPVYEDFDYRAYLARQGIHSVLYRPRSERVASDQGSPFWTLLYRLRGQGAALVNRVLPEPAAALANGMLLGIEAGIPPALAADFNTTGAAHVIVISGSNIVLLTTLLLAAASRLLGLRRAACLTAVTIGLYVLLVGASPSALRAGLMGILYVLAIVFGRQNVPFVSLFTATFLLTLWDPLTLWDIGFQLSFAATLGLVVLAPPLRVRLKTLLERLFPRAGAGGLLGLFSESVILTLAAQITTVPLLVYHFGRLSLLSPLTNFLIVPAQPLVLSSGLAMIVLGMCWEPLARIIAVVPWLMLTYTTAVVQWAATVPFASVDTGGSSQLLGAIGYVLLSGLWLLHRLEAGGRSLLPSPSRALLLTAPFLLPVLQFAGTPLLPDGRLHVMFLPVGDGEAVLVVTPEGRRVCVWDGRGDLDTLERAVAGVTGSRNPTAHLFVGPGEAPWPAAAHVDLGHLAPGGAIRIDDVVTLRRLDAGFAEGSSSGPEELDNGASRHAVLGLAYGQFAAVLPFGLDAGVREDTLTNGASLHATVFKVPHTGMAPEPAAAIMAAISPQMALWPEDGALAPQTDAVSGATSGGIARVPPGASVEVITDGTRFWLKQWSNVSER